MHKPCDLSSQDFLSSVWLVACLLHAGFQGIDVIQRDERQQLQETNHVRICCIGEQVLVEFERRQLTCKQNLP